MRIVCISDTHNLHRDLTTRGSRLSLPAGDLLIHAGDLTGQGGLAEVAAALNWLGEVRDRYALGVVFIAGNHDFLAERDPDLFRSLVPEGVTYLNDSGVELEGVKFWGSPITPWFHNWAFNRHAHEIGAHWDLISDDTAVLITHGPPRGVLDRVLPHGEHVGCPLLLEAVRQIEPKLHVFGHIHEGYGATTAGLPTSPTTFVNASFLDHRYRPANAPMIFNL